MNQTEKTFYGHTMLGAKTAQDLAGQPSTGSPTKQIPASLDDLEKALAALSTLVDSLDAATQSVRLASVPKGVGEKKDALVSTKCIVSGRVDEATNTVQAVYAKLAFIYKELCI